MHHKNLIPSRRTATALMAVASTMPMVITSANAQSSLAKREMIRRQNDIANAERLLVEGREAYAKGDYPMAVDKYKQALGKVPDVPSNPALVQRRQVIKQHFADASVALAMQHRKVGKYDEARTLLESVLKEDPNNMIASRELGYLDDPIRTNPALTYEHTQNVDKVRRTLYMAEGYYNLGRYDAAKKEYEDVLRIDPYNTAARRGMERLAQARADYYRAAYGQTRAELLSDVDKAWELTVPATLPELPVPDFNQDRQTGGVTYITEKLRDIIIPSINFEDITVEEAVDFLRMRSKELDRFELDPSKKGVNFVIRKPRGNSGGGDDGLDVAAAAGGDDLIGGDDPSALRIPELRLTNVPLAVALKYICDMTKLRYKVDDYAVTLVPLSEGDDDTFTRSFAVPPNFQSGLEASVGPGGGGVAEVDPFSDPAPGPSLLTERAPIKELLANSGIKFGDNTSASLNNAGTLLVTNTATELDKIEQLVDSFKAKQPKQIKITTKFVEITQENNDELGFDWIISPFSVGSDMFGAGGTIGNGVTRLGNDFSGPGIPGVAPGTDPVTNIVTAGNRTGDGAIARNSIDAVLNNPSRAAQNQNVAPGILSLTGLFSDGEVKMIMRGLSQRKGMDLMTAPSITAKSGEKATIEIIREFIYPTEYEPPQIPQQQGGNFGGGGGGGGGIINNGGIQTFPVTPATPTAFDVRNTGVTLEVEPNISDNDFMIDLRFVPEITEFEGFINYGSPITTGGTDALGNPVQITLTENRIEMPVFSTRRVNSSLTIYDGYTVAVGGLMREDVQMVEDKVPILGDIPLIGRLFQSSADNRIKSNLIVFVTAQIIDATGRPLRGGEIETPPVGPADPNDLLPLPGGLQDPAGFE